MQNTNQRRHLQTPTTFRPAGTSATYAVIPSVVSSIQDVGGTAVLRQLTNPAMSTHGSNPSDMPLFFDGMRYNSLFGTGGAGGSYVVNPAIIQELAIDLMGGSAENMVSGLISNVVPKQGGNAFSTYLFGNYTNESLRGNNIDDDLKARGLSATTGLNYVGETNLGFGGPLKRDKIWFYSGFRYARLRDTPPGAYYAKDPTAYVFVPDTSRPAQLLPWSESLQLRATWQVKPQHQINIFADDNNRCGCMDGLSATRAYEATTIGDAWKNRLQQFGWRWTASNRLLIDTGFTNKPNGLRYFPRPEVPLGRIGVNDTGTGIVSRANYGVGIADDEQWHRNGKATLSYVTGSHAVKIGTARAGSRSARRRPGLLFLGGQRPEPRNNPAVGVDAEDEHRQDLRPGSVDPETADAEREHPLRSSQYVIRNSSRPRRFIPQRAPAGDRERSDWSDINPRLGAAFGVFGNGRPPVK